MFVQNVCKIVLLFFVLFPLSLLFFSPPAHADGGAPNLAYVSGTSHGISVIDIAQQKVTNSISVTGDPHTILLSVDGRLLYVTQPALHSMTVIVTQTKKPLCSVQLPGHPSLLTLDPGTNTLYVAGSDTNVVSALDPTTCAIEHTVHTNSPVGGMAVAVIGGGISGGSGNQLWVADKDGLTVFDSSGKKLATIPVEGGPEYLCTPPGGMIYVTTHKGSVEAVDIQSHQVLPPLLSGGTFGPMDYDAMTGEVYVPDMQHSLLAVLTPVGVGNTVPPHEPGRVIHVSVAPQSIAITSDGQLGFVALENGKIDMLDIPGRQVASTFQVGGSPHFIITGLYPSMFSLTPQQASVLSIASNLSHYLAIIIIVISFIIIVLRSRLKRPR